MLDWPGEINIVIYANCAPKFIKCNLRNQTSVTGTHFIIRAEFYRLKSIWSNSFLRTFSAKVHYSFYILFSTAALS